MKHWFWFSLQVLSEAFLTVTRSESDSPIQVFMKSNRYSIGLHEKYPLFYWSSWKVPVILLVFMKSTRYSIGLHEKYPLFYWSSWKVPVILLVFMKSTRYSIGLHEKYPLFLSDFSKT